MSHSSLTSFHAQRPRGWQHCQCMGLACDADHHQVAVALPVAVVLTQECTSSRHVQCVVRLAALWIPRWRWILASKFQTKHSRSCVIGLESDHVKCNNLKLTQSRASRLEPCTRLLQWQHVRVETMPSLKTCVFVSCVVPNNSKTGYQLFTTMHWKWCSNYSCNMAIVRLVTPCNYIASRTASSLAAFRALPVFESERKTKILYCREQRDWRHCCQPSCRRLSTDMFTRLLAVCWTL